MRKFEISTDSTCDLYADEIKKYKIDVGHLEYVITNGDNVETFAEATKIKEEISDIELEFDNDKNMEEDLEMNEDFDNIFDESALFDDFDEE